MKLKRDSVSIGGGDDSMHLDALTIEVEDGSESHLEVLLDERDELIAFSNQMYADAEIARGERDMAMTRMQDPVQRAADVEARTAIMDVAEFVGLKRDDLHEMHDPEIKRAIVVQHRAGIITDDSSDEMVQGCYNMILADSEMVTTNRHKLDALGATASNRPQPGRNMQPGDVNDSDAGDNRTYREIAEDKLDGLAELSSEEFTGRFA